MTTTERARYKVLELSWINNTLQNPGAIVEYDGRPGTTLEPINEAAHAAVAAAGPIGKPVVVPLVAVSAPPGADVDWREAAREAGWLPPVATGEALNGQAPQVQPVAEAAVEGKVEGKAGGAAARLNQSKDAGSADI